jgi:hypothetical protein
MTDENLENGLRTVYDEMDERLKDLSSEEQ